MKNIIIIIFVLFIGANMASAQTDSLVAIIKKECGIINKNIKHLKIKTIDLPGESSEGGQGTAYFEKDSIKLVDATYFSETGKIRIEYYFDKGNLILVIPTNYEYNRPITWDKKTAGIIEDTSKFDPKQTRIWARKFYFNDGHLIQMLDDNKEMDVKAMKIYYMGITIIENAWKLRGKFGK